jgi:hypothetical protein
MVNRGLIGAAAAGAVAVTLTVADLRTPDFAFVQAPAFAQQPPATAEAIVIAQRLDMDLPALPDYGNAVFSNGEVAEAVAAEHGGQPDDIVPARASVVVEPDSIVLRVIGHDTDLETAADIANTAAKAFVEQLNNAGTGVGVFTLQSPAD